MKCDLYRSALAELALGAPAPPLLESHLADCGLCRAALVRQQSLLDRLDREVRASLHATPSAEFLPRVRQRVADQAVAPQPWLVRWLVPSLALVGMLMAAVLSTGRRLGEPRPMPRQAAVEEPVAVPALLRPPSPQAAPRTPVRAMVARPARRGEAEVLVPPEQEALLRRFIEGTRHRRLDHALVLPAGPDALETREVQVDPAWLVAVDFDPGEPRDIDAAPIDVGPLSDGNHDEE